MKAQKQYLLAFAIVITTTFSSSTAWSDVTIMKANNAIKTQDQQLITKEESSSSNQTTMDDRYTQGEIRKVDIAQGKLTIKHGDIKNLGMPSMTMVFRIIDPAMAKSVKTGDKVWFVVEKQQGALVITELKKST